MINSSTNCPTHLSITCGWDKPSFWSFTKNEVYNYKNHEYKITHTRKASSFFSRQTERVIILFSWSFELNTLHVSKIVSDTVPLRKSPAVSSIKTYTFFLKREVKAFFFVCVSLNLDKL